MILLYTDWYEKVDNSVVDRWLSDIFDLKTSYRQ